MSNCVTLTEEKVFEKKKIHTYSRDRLESTYSCNRVNLRKSAYNTAEKKNA